MILSYLPWNFKEGFEKMVIPTLHGTDLNGVQVIGTTEAPAFMEVNGQYFPVAAMVEIFPGVEKPLLDIPQMSDFSWQLGALEDRLKDPDGYARTLGENVADKVAGLRQWLREHISQATPAERMRFQEVAQ